MDGARPPLTALGGAVSQFRLHASRRLTFAIVAVQLKILIADGTASKNVTSENATPWYIDWLVTNMWCPHTKKPRNAIAREENATKW